MWFLENLISLTKTAEILLITTFTKLLFIAQRNSQFNKIPSLETFPVHHWTSTLVVIVPGHPHVFEGGEGGQDGPTDPHRILSGRWGLNFDADVVRGHAVQLLVNPLRHSCEGYILLKYIILNEQKN